MPKRVYEAPPLPDQRISEAVTTLLRKVEVQQDQIADLTKRVRALERPASTVHWHRPQSHPMIVED